MTPPAVRLTAYGFVGISAVPTRDKTKPFLLMPDDLASHFIDKKSNSLHVILIKDDAGKPSLLYDPGMSRPWSSTNPQLAKFYASTCDGMACTWKEAWTILTKAHPGFEKDLMERIKSGNNVRPQNLNDN